MKFADYKIGIVMTRAGLNEGQLQVFFRHLQERARMCDGLTVVVPTVAYHGEETPGPKAITATENVALPLRSSAGSWKLDILKIGAVEDLMPCLRELDEVWCATTTNQSERVIRPAKVMELAGQDSRTSSRFKWLHFWVERQVLGGTDVRAKKKTNVLKGY